MVAVDYKELQTVLCFVFFKNFCKLSMGFIFTVLCQVAGNKNILDACFLCSFAEGFECGAQNAFALVIHLRFKAAEFEPFLAARTHEAFGIKMNV